MITLITGAPGSGKTAALVDLIHTKWADRRTIYSYHLAGLQIPHIELTIEEVRRWHEVMPVDSVLIVDECQRVWRRDRSAKVSPDIEAMETHRHEGIDIYLVSQNPTLIADNVRLLVGRHIHIRDLGPPWGRYWYEWPEATPVAQFKSAPIKKRYKLPKRIFHLYKSSSKHIKPIRSVPKQLWILSLAVVVGGFFAFKAYSNVQARLDPSHGASAVAAAASSARPVAASSPVYSSSSSGVVASAAAVVAAAVAPPPPPKFSGCIQIGRIERTDGFVQVPRCECIDTEGRSVEVDLQACRDNTQRSGLQIPYPMTAPPRQVASAEGSHAGEGLGASPVRSAPVSLGSQRSDVRAGAAR